MRSGVRISSGPRARNRRSEAGFAAESVASRSAPGGAWSSIGHHRARAPLSRGARCAGSFRWRGTTQKGTGTTCGDAPPTGGDCDSRDPSDPVVALEKRHSLQFLSHFSRHGTGGLCASVMRAGLALAVMPSQCSPQRHPGPDRDQPHAKRESDVRCSSGHVPRLKEVDGFETNVEKVV